MNQTIYIDVLVLLNIYVSYFLIVSTKKLLVVEISKPRLIISCLVSGIYSLIILFDFYFVEFIIIKLIMGISLCAIAFYNKRLNLFIKAILMFFLVNFIYAGLMFCLWYFITPVSMQYKNGVVYFNISALMLAIFTIIAYCSISLFSYILNKRNNKNDIFTVTISFAGREIMLSAFLDTGNKLVDAFSGLPVMVCELSELKSLLPQKLYDYFLSPNDYAIEKKEDYLISKRIRMIPINVVSGTGSLMAFKPDCILLLKDGVCYHTKALVAVTNQRLSDGTFHALISNAMLNNKDNQKSETLKDTKNLSAIQMNDIY